MKSHSLSITAKFAAIQVLLVASLIAVVAVAWWHLPSSVQAREVELLVRAQRATQQADMLHDALQADVLSALLASHNVGKSNDAVRRSLHNNAQGFRSELAVLDLLAGDIVLGPTLTTARAASIHYLDLAEEMVRLALEDTNTARLQQVSFNGAFEAAKTALAQLTALIAHQLETANANARRATEEARRWLLIAASITFVAACVGVAVIARSIRRSLMRLQAVAHAVADGELDRRSDQSGADEIGQLAQSVNQMAENLHQMIQRIRVDAERSDFGVRLGAALDMADNESEAYRVIERAMTQISNTHAMELLLTDSSETQLQRVTAHPEGSEPGCSVDSPSACIAVRSGRSLTFGQSDALDACPKLRQRRPELLSATCVPVTFMGRAFGILHACGSPDEVPNQDTTDRLTMLAKQAGARIGTLRAFERTQLQACTDPLTGLANRRRLEVSLRELLREQRPFAFVMADLDHFKDLNDTHGHQTGDDALRAFADVVRESQRAHDFAGRWGGEEFALVLVHADAAQALQWVDRLRERLALALPSRGLPLFSASFGIADSRTRGPLETIIAAADLALYQAKSAGRDRGVLASQAEAAHSPASDPGAQDRKGNVPPSNQMRSETFPLSAIHDRIVEFGTDISRER